MNELPSPRPDNGQSVMSSRRGFTTSVAGALLAAVLPLPAGPRVMAQEGTPASGATRLVVDLTGREVEVPAEPQRVVALDPGITVVHLVDLGIVPAGAATDDTNPNGRFSPVIDDVSGQIAEVGLVGNVSLERIAAVQPDLILYATPYQDIPFDRLQAIAPTVAYDWLPTNEEHFLFIGEVVNRQAEAERIIADFDATVAAYRGSMGLAGRRVAASHLLNYDSAPTFSVLGPGSEQGEILAAVGAKLVPEAIDGEPVVDYVFDLSLEVAADLLADAEVLVVTHYIGGEDLEQNFRRIVDSPLWQRIPAVEQGRVVVMDYQGIAGNWGVRGLELALEELAAQIEAMDL